MPNDKIVPLVPIVESPQGSNGSNNGVVPHNTYNVESPNQVSTPRNIEIPKPEKTPRTPRKNSSAKSQKTRPPSEKLAVSVSQTELQRFDDSTTTSKFPKCGCCPCKWHIKFGTTISLLLLLTAWLIFTIIIGELGGGLGLLIALPLFAVYCAAIALKFFGVYAEHPQLMIPYLVVLTLSILVYLTVITVLICLFAGAFGEVTISTIAVLVFIWAILYTPMTVYFLFAGIRCYRYILAKQRKQFPRTDLSGRL